MTGLNPFLSLMSGTLIALFFVFGVFEVNSFAETVNLKSGRSITGKIVFEDKDSIRLDTGSAIPLTYFRDDIQNIIVQSGPKNSAPQGLKDNLLGTPGPVKEAHRFRITKNFHFHSLANLLQFEFSFPVPRSDIAGQTVSNITWSPLPQALKPDANGYQVAAFKYPKVSADQKFDIQLKYEVEFEVVPEVVDSVKTNSPISPLPLSINEFLKLDAEVGGVDQTLGLTVNLLTKGKDNFYDKGMALYHFVIDTIHYELRDNTLAPRSPQETLSSGHGNCVDISLLFVSLARRAGIPARLVNGLVFQTSDKERTLAVSQTGHTWAEIYLPQYGWRAVDTTFGLKNKKQYYCFAYKNHIREFYGQVSGRPAGLIYQGQIMAIPWFGEPKAKKPIEQTVDLVIEKF